MKPLRSGRSGGICGGKLVYMLIGVIAIQALSFLILLFYKTNCNAGISGKTMTNLRESFAGESMARNRYMMFAEQAKKEGLDEIATKFTDIASQEVLHARSMYKIFNGGIKSTKENLKESIEGESYEEQTKYPKMARIAREEGNEAAAKVFESIYEMEKQHKGDFQWLLKKYFT